ncbi:ribosomal large subunit pseudouridine synthase C [Spirochaetota bacterium]|nr:ribosomal large subunit pseudouridine synthase C [Spirochaetota bacterium]
MKKYHLDLVYEGDNIVVVNKVAGLPCQGGAGIRTHLLSLLTEKYGVRPHLLHRLDRETSGLIVVVKGSTPRNKLAAYYKGFQAGSKFYKLLVKGRFLKKQFWHLSDRRNRKGKEEQAATFYRVMRSFSRFSYIEAKLGTGREHQIRRDMAELGHPILGDDKYGDFTLNKILRRNVTGAESLYLVAYKLHWTTGTAIHSDLSGRKFEIPLPQTFQQFLARYNITP